MGFLVFCDADEEGQITAYVAGQYIMPDRQYQYFYYLNESIDVSEYKIVDNKLQKI
jgi:hypothetical protein